MASRDVTNFTPQTGTLFVRNRRAGSARSRAAAAACSVSQPDTRSSRAASACHHLPIANAVSPTASHRRHATRVAAPVARATAESVTRFSRQCARLSSLFLKDGIAPRLCSRRGRTRRSFAVARSPPQRASPCRAPQAGAMSSPSQRTTRASASATLPICRMP